jgi:hypothetical protein
VINGSLYAGATIVSGSEESNVAFSVGSPVAAFVEDSSLTDRLFSILAKDPGTWGDDVSVVIKNIKGGSESEETERYTFEIDVYHTDSEGTTSKVENWKVSRKQNKLDGYGRQLYMEDKINDYSNYIFGF